MGIENPNAWTAAQCHAAGIGVGSPHHPFHNVYFDEENQFRLPDEVHANVEEAKQKWPGFPSLAPQVVQANLPGEDRLVEDIVITGDEL